MCFGSKSKTVVAPPPTPPTTFDYSAANRGQADANAAQRQAQAGTVLSSTQPGFGSELGGAQPKPATP